MSNRHKHILEGFAVFLAAFGFALLNSWHVISYYLRRPPHTVFIGITHYYQDYFYYLSQVTQGTRGAWTARNLFTTENIPATVLWLPNVILGKVASLTGIVPWTLYHWALFVASFASLVLLYAASSRFFPNSALKRIGTFLIAITSSMLYVWKTLPNGTKQLVPYEYFYNYTASLNRIGGVFHLVLQNILSLLSILLAADITDTIVSGSTNRRTFIARTAGLSLCFILLLFINPAYVAINMVSIALFAIPRILIQKKKPSLGHLIFVMIMVCAPLVIPGMIILNTFTHPFYMYFRDWEASVLRTTPRIFFQSMGIIGALALPGSIPFLVKSGSFRKIGALWTLLPIALYFSPVPGMLHIPTFRLTQPPSYIFLAAMAMETLALPSVIFGKLNMPKIGRTITISLIGLFVLYQIPVLSHELKVRMNNYVLPSWMNYMPEDLYKGLMVLERQPPGITMSIGNVELLIPALTGKPVYCGHNSLTLDYDRKIVDVVWFFSQKFDHATAAQFLKRENIAYIVRRTLDDPDKTLPAAYPFLKPVFYNSELQIYKAEL